MPIVVAQLPALCALSAVQQHQTLAQQQQLYSTRRGKWISAVSMSALDFDFLKRCDLSTSVT